MYMMRAYLRGLVLVVLEGEEHRGLEELCNPRVDLEPDALVLQLRALDDNE
jgi:hypothetical protein